MRQFWGIRGLERPGGPLRRPTRRLHVRSNALLGNGFVVSQHPVHSGVPSDHCSNAHSGWIGLSRYPGAGSGEWRPTSRACKTACLKERGRVKTLSSPDKRGIRTGELIEGRAPPRSRGQGGAPPWTNDLDADDDWRRLGSAWRCGRCGAGGDRHGSRWARGQQGSGCQGMSSRGGARMMVFGPNRAGSIT